MPSSWAPMSNTFGIFLSQMRHHQSKKAQEGPMGLGGNKISSHQMLASGRSVYEALPSNVSLSLTLNIHTCSQGKTCSLYHSNSHWGHLPLQETFWQCLETFLVIPVRGEEYLKCKIMKISLHLRLQDTSGSPTHLGEGVLGVR
jgi:hypothetical protein